MPLTSQISFDPNFISGLLEKLKVGNRRGIHLNALPGRHRSRLDLHDLDFVRKGMADEFLKKLLSESSFSLRIDFEGINMTELSEDEQNRLFLIARRLDNLVVDIEDQYLEFGIKNFALGYPLLIRRDRSDPTKIINAPLMLWSFNIEKSPRKMNCWTISREEGSPIVVNELLRSHIASDAQINIDRLSEDFLSDSVIDASEISK